MVHEKRKSLLRGGDARRRFRDVASELQLRVAQLRAGRHIFCPGCIGQRMLFAPGPERQPNPDGGREEVRRVEVE